MPVEESRGKIVKVQPPPIATTPRSWARSMSTIPPPQCSRDELLSISAWSGYLDISDRLRLLSFGRQAFLMWPMVPGQNRFLPIGQKDARARGRHGVRSIGDHDRLA
jgi:hypothetical protein